MHQKAKLQNARTFTGNGSHCHIRLLLVIKIKTCTHQLCERQSADADYQQNGQYRLSVPLYSLYISSMFSIYLSFFVNGSDCTLCNICISVCLIIIHTSVIQRLMVDCHFLHFTSRDAICATCLH